MLDQASGQMVWQTGRQFETLRCSFNRQSFLKHLTISRSVKILLVCFFKREINSFILKHNEYSFSLHIYNQWQRNTLQKSKTWTKYLSMTVKIKQIKSSTLTLKSSLRFKVAWSANVPPMSEVSSILKLVTVNTWSSTGTSIKGCGVGIAPASLIKKLVLNVFSASWNRPNELRITQLSWPRGEPGSPAGLRRNMVCGMKTLRDSHSEIM